MSGMTFSVYITKLFTSHLTSNNKMQNERAVTGLHQILAKLDDYELYGLATTVTQGLLVKNLKSRDEAISTILKHSPDEVSILKRKVITRNILFTYLHESDVSVTTPFTKADLIEKICKFWKVRYKRNDDNYENSPEIIRSKEEQQIIQSKPPESQQNEIDLMAKQFCEWFYNMMNENSPIGEEHFWEEARLKLNLISGSQSITETVDSNVTEIVQLLFKKKFEHSLYFNPNLLKEGVQGRIQPHGLVVIVVCGTLHKNNSCIGVFEQLFMLARDPFSDNNWKIKVTELNLHSKDNVCALPNLNDSELTSTVLALPSSVD